VRKEAERRTEELERNNRALTEDNPLVMCLVDGDGNIFSPELVSAGHTGGAQAAHHLNRGIVEHLKTLTGTPTKNPQIWLTIYCNLSGLRDTFLNFHHCTVEQYDAFIEGFNMAAPLFSIVDVGPSKEAADTKLKESLRVFTRFPQIVKVYFGGLHDNGYTTTLSHLQTEGLLNKLIALRGYSEIAWQLRDYKIPECNIPGVFMTQKMQVRQNLSLRKPPTTFNQAQPNLYFPQPQGDPPFARLQPSPSFNQAQPNLHFPQPQANPPFARLQPSPSFSPPMPTASPFQPMSAPTSPEYVTRVISPPSPVLYVDPTLPLHKQTPPPCNFFYLARCRDGKRCRFGHHYILSSEELADFRRTAKKYPCPINLREGNCEFGDSCCMGHVCPRGMKCIFLKQGKCKYTREDMHIAAPTQPGRYGKYRVRHQSVDGNSEITPSESGISQ